MALSELATESGLKSDTDNDPAVRGSPTKAPQQPYLLLLQPEVGARDTARASPHLSKPLRHGKHALFKGPQRTVSLWLCGVVLLKRGLHVALFFWKRAQKVLSGLEVPPTPRPNVPFTHKICADRPQWMWVAGREGGRHGGALWRTETCLLHPMCVGC